MEMTRVTVKGSLSAEKGIEDRVKRHTKEGSADCPGGLKHALSHVFSCFFNKNVTTSNRAPLFQGWTSRVITYYNICG
ncbi:hypothetical protein [Gorillibacterium massiliense]|uniref:hypothetical protein n=1 Tax=Gorillibacterium massiliense TaxID=1280390 RepID=UPI00059339FC|nr:hypothetical protein [Gorillibacterium massiliense]